MKKNSGYQKTKRTKNTMTRKQWNKNQEIITHPPQLDGLELRHAVTLRYISKAAFVKTSIAFAELMTTIAVCLTPGTFAQVFQAVKIRRIRMWGMPAVGSATSIQLEYQGTTVGVIGDQALHTDTSMGIQPAHIDARPAQKSLASNYQLNTGGTAFNFSGPAGTVIDAELSFRGYAYGTTPSTFASLGVVGTAGVIYLVGIDGLVAASSNFTPEYSSGAI